MTQPNTSIRKSLNAPKAMLLEQPRGMFAALNIRQMVKECLVIMGKITKQEKDYRPSFDTNVLICVDPYEIDGYAIKLGDMLLIDVHQKNIYLIQKTGIIVELLAGAYPINETSFLRWVDADKELVISALEIMSHEAHKKENFDSIIKQVEFRFEQVTGLPWLG